MTPLLYFLFHSSNLHVTKCACLAHITHPGTAPFICSSLPPFLSWVVSTHCLFCHPIIWNCLGLACFEGQIRKICYKLSLSLASYFLGVEQMYRLTFLVYLGAKPCSSSWTFWNYPLQPQFGDSICFPNLTLLSVYGHTTLNTPDLI